MCSSITAGTKTVATVPNWAAIRATARPWLPSVAVTSSAPGWRSSTCRQAHEAPSTLNAGRPIRSDSSLTRTRPTPQLGRDRGHGHQRCRPIAGERLVERPGGGAGLARRPGPGAGVGVPGGHARQCAPEASWPFLSQPWNDERSPASHASRSPGVLRSQSGRISRVACAQVVPQVVDRRTAPEPVAVVDAVDDQPRLEHEGVRDHRVVVGVGVLLDVQILLDGPLGVGQERPLGADRGPELLQGVVYVGRDRRDLGVGDRDLRTGRPPARGAAGAPWGSSGRGPA